MRIDAHHSFSERYTLDYLGTIFKRNRFEGSVLIVRHIPPELPDFVRAIVVMVESIDPRRLDEWQRNPRFRGVRCAVTPSLHVDELVRRGLTLEAEGRPAVFPPMAMTVDIEHMADVPPGADVYWKVIGLTRLVSPQELVGQALDRFGPERLMFGSDWPNGLPETTWKAALAHFTQSIGAQPIEVREKLLGESRPLLLKAVATVP